MIAELAGRRKGLPGFMRYCSLVTVLLVSACTFHVPRGIPVRISANVHADVHVRAPSVDAVVVPLQGAPVAEFFGIPLADARDVLFVLDVSGSMSENATGQLAMIPPPPPPPPVTQPSPPVTPPSANDAPGGVQVGPGSPSPPPVPDASSQPLGYPQGYPPPAAAAPPLPPPQQVGARVPSKLEVAQAELIDALAKLPAGTRVNLLLFSNDVDAYAPTIVAIDEASRIDLMAFVRDMRADGATALQPAMRMAFLLNAPRIVLLSDGLGNIGGDRDDIMRDVAEAVKGGVRIDTIGIGPTQDTKLLTALAARTGGLYQRF